MATSRKDSILRRWRRDNQRSLRWIARKTGLSRFTVSKADCGQEISRASATLIGLVLGLRVEDIPHRKAPEE